MSKITPEAKARCAAHTLAEQLEKVRLSMGLTAPGTRQHSDRSDVDLALELDMAWSGQHARLVMPIGGAD